MEPMTLGSPGNVSPVFMPAFLMGEIVASSSAQPEAPITPQRAARRVSFAPESPLPVGPPSAPRPRASEPRRGPPRLGLFDSLSDLSGAWGASGDRSRAETSLGGEMSRAETSLGGAWGASGEMSRADASSPFLEESELDEEAALWVTVFGFYPHLAPSVVAWLASCGEVTARHQPSSPKANWQHLRFSSRAESSRALARHGHRLGPDLMLAVVPCADRGVLDSWSRRAAPPHSFTAAGGTFVFSHSALGLGGGSVGLSGGSAGLGGQLNASLRSLTATPENSVEPYALPRRTNGLVAKTMDVLFGW